MQGHWERGVRHGGVPTLQFYGEPGSERRALVNAQALAFYSCLAVYHSIAGVFERLLCRVAHQSVQGPKNVMWQYSIFFSANKVAVGCGLFTRRSLCVWLHFAGASEWMRTFP